MELSDFIISDKQAEEIARTIFTDIDAFVLAHQAEYEAFLATEREAIADSNKSA